MGEKLGSGMYIATGDEIIPIDGVQENVHSMEIGVVVVVECCDLNIQALQRLAVYNTQVKWRVMLHVLNEGLGCSAD